MKPSQSTRPSGSIFQAVRSYLPRTGSRSAHQLEQQVAALTAELARTETERDRLVSVAAQAAAERDRLVGVAARVVAERDKLAGEVGPLRVALEDATAHLGRSRYLLRQATPGGTQPRQFVFLHIQKTGGISVSQCFSRWFSYLRTAWVFSPEEMDGYDPAELAHYDFVSGHFTARNLSQVRPGAFVCTFLRDPVERVASTYWYFRGYEGPVRAGTRAAVEAARRKSFLDFLRDPDPEVRRHVDNHQCHAVSGDWVNPRPATPSELLAGAVAALDQFDFVGLTEQLEESLQVLYWRAGRPDPGPVERLNQTPLRLRVGDLTPAERGLAAELNAADIELHRIVRERFAFKAVSGRAA